MNNYIMTLAQKAFNVLIVTNPKNTSLGIFSGIFIHGAIGLLNPLFSSKPIINMDALQLWHCISIGIVVFNMPDFFKRDEIDPKIKSASRYIKEQIDAGTVDEEKAQQLYMKLHLKVINDTRCGTDSCNIRH